MHGEMRSALFTYQGTEYQIEVEDVTASGGFIDWQWSVTAPRYWSHSDSGRPNGSPSTAFGLAVMQIVADAQTGQHDSAPSVRAGQPKDWALREFASAVLAHEDLDEPTMEEHTASVLRVRAAIDALQAAGFVPTDRAPIEEGGAHETTD